MLAYPPASVRWKKHPLFPIHRHRSIFGTLCALALITGQVAFAISSIREENQKCEDPNSGEVGHSGVCTCFNGYQHSNGACEVDDFGNSPKLRVSIEDEEVYASFEGSYGSDASDGTFNQDFVGGVVGGLKEGSITMFGNAWKVYKFQEQLTIKKLTILEFYFEPSEKSEGNAICLEEDKNEDTYGGLRTRCVAIIMNDDTNQVDKWNNVQKVQGYGRPGTYRVNAGSLFNDQTTQVQYLAFIQDNDSLPLEGKSTFSNIKIYEDTSSTSLSITWTPVSKRDKDVSTQSGPVSVSEDGNVAIYASSGVVHQLQKSSSTSCQNGFPGCEEIQWNVLIRNGSTVWSDEFSEENSGYSSRVLQGISSIHCLGDKCDRKSLRHNGNDEVLARLDYQWTDWFSEEHDANQKCSDNRLVSKIQCQGSWCDNMRLLCSPALTGYRSTDDTMETGWFSEEKPGAGYCWNGYYVYGIKCSGSHCDNIKLYCRKIEKRQYPSLVHNDWPDYYALPSPEQLSSPPNKCPSGTEVPQTECHLAGIAVQRQAGWNTLKWNVLYQSHHSNLPCGCFIWNSNKIFFNSDSSCNHHGAARSVCKSSTKNPQRTPDITIEPPQEIGSGNGFGEEAKVLSYDGNEIAIAAPGASKIAVYSLTGSNYIPKSVINGYNPAISSGGEFIGIASAKSGSQCNIDLFGRKNGNFLHVFKNTIGCYFISEGIAITYQDVEGIWLDTKDRSYNLSCSDSNAKLVIQGNISPVICLCNDGFINSGPDGGKILQDTFSCISSLRADNVVVTADSVQFSMTNSLKESYNETKLLKKSQPNDIAVSLTENKFVQSGIDDVNTLYELSHLEPGSRYTVTLWNKANVDTISFPVVTTCSCGSDNIDKTGRPDGVSVTQSNGHVMFTFTDNSLCEEGFSFTRSDYAEEFLADVSKYGVAFTRDYYFIGGSDCRSTISTGTDASDNLAYSNLPVGKQYMYCVRAVHSSHYMDHPLDSLEGRRMESSDDACAPHKIHWEASIHGNISTAPNAGSLPIKDVEVSWELMDMDHETPIGCKGCYGNSNTTDGGTFKIAFNIDDSALSYNNDDNKREFSVRIKFSKMSGDITHKFLCNNGEDDCSGDIGTAVFIKHLQFGEVVNIYDDTSVPFSGRVLVDNSDFDGHKPCPLSKVNVCLMKNNKFGAMDPIVCSETGSNGVYEIPIIIGSRIDDVQLSYHNHTFRSDGQFEKGTLIEENGFYGNNDFKDVQKARLFVDVVGGLCEKRLGNTQIQIQMRRCADSGILIYDHNVVRDVYNSVPAHQLDVEVVEVFKSDGEERNIKIWEYFQSPPIIQTIDLRSTGIVDKSLEEENNSILTNTTKGTKNEEDVRNNELDNIAEMEKDEEENLELVRFQYDGDLKIDVQMLGDLLTCNNYDSTIYPIEEGESSFHVLSSMKNFLIMVTFLYDLTEGLTCDIVDAEDLKLQITNKIGADSQSDKDFLSEIEDETSKELLLKCADGCVQDIAHETNADGKLSYAHTFVEFAAGLPSTVDPAFDKHMSLKVQTTSGTIVSEFNVISVVEGVISKGNARSFALPTHKPIMILRDPPGGLSYSSYKHIKTTFKFETSSTSTTLNHKFSINSKLVTSLDAPLCTGGGGGLAGPLIAMCKKLLETKSTQQMVGLTQTTGGKAQMDEDTISYQLATTWSYETSQDPWLAGKMSDVFVVPNLNVPYEDVYVVEWDNSTCSVIMDDDNVPRLPVTTTIFFDQPKSQPAVSFFSRYHVINIKLKEIARTIENRQKTKVNCECDNQIPIDNDDCNCAELHEELTALQESEIEWNKALEYDNTLVLEPENSIINWFKDTDVLEHDEYDEEFGKLKSDTASSSSSALAPPVLASKSEWIKTEMPTAMPTAIPTQYGAHRPTQFINSPYRPETDGEKEKAIETAKRIQFSGGGNKFSMNMKQEKVLKKVGLACWHGCNTDSNSEMKGPGLSDSLLKTFGNGVKLELNPLDFNIHVSHDSTEGGSDTESTTMELVLGDGDKGDEFVVDLYYDDKYGTVLFNTTGGQSKCPHEDGTDANENPLLIIEDRPRNVFPNEEMIFKLSMQNKGLRPTTFSLDVQNRDNADGLKVTLDGVPLGEKRDFWIPTTDKKYFKTLAIERGPYLYDYPPIDLILKSTCGDLEKIVTEKIYNTYPDIKFVEPCPRVEWAGELNRDRDFLVNTKSDDTDSLVVRVFNPNHSTGTFHSIAKTNGDRLESVNLEFRKVGSTDWKVANSNIEDDDGNILPVNFSLRDEFSEGKKPYYGYEKMEWKLPSTQGVYEIRLGTKCETIQDAPNEINHFYAPILSGVIDLTPPKQHGSSLPLRDTVLIGEEINVVFTEALTCTKPYIFDIKLIIDGTDIELGLEDPSLSVICEGRMIGVQIDPAEQDIDIDLIVGKSFNIKLSNVLDINGNGLEANGFIQVDKTFAPTNLEESSISFTLTIKAFENNKLCKEVDGVVTKDVIVSQMGMTTSESDRLVLDNTKCIDEGNIIAEVRILPKNAKRRKLRQDLLEFSQSSDSPLNMFYNLKTLSEDTNALRRARKLTVKAESIDDEKFTFQLSNLKIIPSPSDMEMLKMPPNLAEEEEKLLKIIRNSSIDGHPDDVVGKLSNDIYSLQKTVEKQIQSMNKTAEDMTSMFIQMFVIAMGCMIILLVIFYQLVKYDNYPDSKNNTMTIKLNCQKGSDDGIRTID